MSDSRTPISPLEAGKPSSSALVNNFILLRKKTGAQLQNHWFAGGIGALLTVIFGLALLEFNMGKSLRDSSYDFPFLCRLEKPNKDIVIVYLDETSYHELNQSPTDFDRNLHAQLIRRLKAAGARMIVFDMVFFDTKTNNRAALLADDQFARAMREHGRVVLGAQYEETKNLGVAENQIVPPLESFRNACAGWGLVLIDRDSDFSPRRIFEESDRIPSLGWKSAEIIGAKITQHSKIRQQERWLNYYAREPFVGISYSKVLQDRQLQLAPAFKDKVVFVGAGNVAGYAGEKKEEFKNPWTWLTRHFHLGVELHALTFSNLVHGDWLNRTSETFEVLLVIFSGILLGYGLTLFRPPAATGMGILFALLVLILAYAFFVRSLIWFPWLVIVAQVPLAWAYSIILHSIKTYTETKLLESSLALYLSPHQAKQILKSPELLKPGAKKETISILFSDIANFSKISQRMDANDLVRLLNEYYEAAIGCIHQTDGTVVNLIGDAILAIWNAPQPQPDHQERACRAALLLNQKLVHFEAGSTALPLVTRIGVHSGNVCVGNIGSSTRFDYTAIGDDVNMASRLEGLNKQLGTNILATREIQRAVEKLLVSRMIGHFKFKGFDSVTEIYELIATMETAETSRPWRETFAKGIWNFQRKLFTEAEECFRQTLTLHPDDGPAAYYLKKIPEFKSRSLGGDWIGEIDLQEK